MPKVFGMTRFDFAFVAPTAPLNECLDSALKSSKHPFFISDMGDNPTAGGAGDVTWTLKQILSRPEFKTEMGLRLIYASIPGPGLVENAIRAGVGSNSRGIGRCNGRCKILHRRYRFQEQLNLLNMVIRMQKWKSLSGGIRSYYRDKKTQALS